jgi:hypothetical protein
MPAPNLPPRKAPPSAPKTPTLPLSPHLAGLQAMLNELAKSERTTQLVDYLYDLRREMLWVADRLAELDFDAFAFLSELDDEDDDDHDCPEEEW